ncbi:MAG TPA: ester cyclase [Ktedonobacteraceae bacterium]|nr:ester cyclase [Ktedonobacteraceae bacterium]
MSTEQNKANFRAIPEHILNTGDFDAIDQLFTADYVDHAALPPGLPDGVEGVKVFFRMLRSAFPDLHYTVEVVLAEGDLAAGHVSVTGTHKGEFMGIPPTGKQLRWTETHMGRLVDGKLAEHWGDYDQLGMLQQLGVMG